MLVLNDIEGEKYKKFIEYSCKKNNAVLFVTKQLCDSITKNEKIEYIFNKLNIKDDEIIEKNKDRIINLCYNEVKDNIEFWDGIYNILNENEKMNIIKNIVEIEIINKEWQPIIKKQTKYIREKLADELIKIRHDSKWCGGEEIVHKPQNGIKYDICVYKITNNLKELLLETNSLRKIKPPYFPEDISFFKNGECWMTTTSHEDIICIYPTDKEDCEKLKNLGLILEKGEEKYEIKAQQDAYEKYDINVEIMDLLKQDYITYSEDIY